MNYSQNITEASKLNVNNTKITAPTQPTSENMNNNNKNNNNLSFQNEQVPPQENSNYFQPNQPPHPAVRHPSNTSSNNNNPIASAIPQRLRSETEKNMPQPSNSHIFGTSPSNLDFDLEPERESGIATSAPTMGISGIKREHNFSSSNINEEANDAETKDRLKKDNHNAIERRRRYNINDRIRELGTMIPQAKDPDHRWNKGTILKASVDYIKELQGNIERLRRAETQNKQLEAIARKLALRVQEQHRLMQSHNIPVQEDPEVLEVLQVLNKFHGAVTPVTSIIKS